MDYTVFTPLHSEMSGGKLGVTRLENGKVRFLVWASKAENVDLHLLRGDRLIPMTRDEYGYFAVEVDDVRHGDRYAFQIDGGDDRPDPTSRSQPDGVHAPSEVIFSDFQWTDADWQAPALRDSVIYELHVGTFTDDGTFDAIIPHLSRLKSIGITTIELMPVAQFPGGRNWGYDGVGLFATQSTYGGIEGLKRLVNAAHDAGMAVILDVVYNHLGPEGNYLGQFAHYFSHRYHNPWGQSVNFDGPHSEHVKRFFIENALFWVEECHLDGFRLDATQELIDLTAVPFMKTLTATLHYWAEVNERAVLVIAENTESKREYLLPSDENGYGLDAIWLDDFHHAFHTFFTGERSGFLSDYGSFEKIVKILRSGFAYSGDYSVFRQRRHGTPSEDLPLDRFVVNIQNHDHAGNRLHGERMPLLVDFETLKLIAAIMFTSPYVPLIFMGDEYGETAPFYFFTSHGDPDLIEAVREGRKKEWAAFEWDEEPIDPQDPATFEKSKINHNLRHEGNHAVMYDLTTRLLALRRAYPEMTNPDRSTCRVATDVDAQTITLYRGNPDNPTVAIVYNLNESQPASLVHIDEAWKLTLDTRQLLNEDESNLSRPHEIAPRSCMVFLR